jgi:hypothetical protein
MSFLGNLFSGQALGGAMTGAGTGAMVGGPGGAGIGALAGLGMGAAQKGSADKTQARQTNLAAATQEFNPWTGMQAAPIDYAQDLQAPAMMQGAAAGAQGWQGYKNMKAQQQELNAKKDYLKANPGSNPWSLYSKY